MLERWWRAAPRSPEELSQLPTRDDACRIALAPDDAGAQRASPAGRPAGEGETAGQDSNSWWTAWKPYVFYALARAFAPPLAGDAACGQSASCLELVEPTGRSLAQDKQFAVLVAGAPLVREGYVQTRAGAGISRVREWLEESNAGLEGPAACLDGAPPPPCESPAACNRVTSAAASRSSSPARR